MADTFQRISAAQAAYARCIDDGRLEDWPRFFAGECLYKITTARNMKEGLEAGIVYLDSPGMIADRVSALRDANIYERHSYRHILGAPYILSEEGGRARTESTFMVARIMHDGATTLFATGRYLDVYVLDGPEPLLAERIAVIDSSRIDTLLALPM